MITFGSLSAQLYAADTIQFNTALFDLEDKKNIDIKQFSRAGIYYAWYLSPQSTSK